LNQAASIPTGCAPLDIPLGGGFRHGELTLVWGEAGTGKTTLMVQTAVQSARRNLKCLFIDADRSFTTQRIAQLAGSETAELSQFIVLFMPESFSQQAALIENLENYMSSRVGLIVFDTITGLYRVALRGREKTFVLNRELTRQLAYLDEFASIHQVPVVLTSQVHARLRPRRSDIEPVARRALFHFPKTILNLKHTPRSRVKSIIVERLQGRDGSTELLVGLDQAGFVQAPDLV
jgi:DNA repair protein RadB